MGADTILYPLESRPVSFCADELASYEPAWNKLARLLAEYGAWLRENGLIPASEPRLQ